MNLLDLLIPSAYAQAAGGAPAGGSGTLGFLLPMIILIGAMYFFVFRKQSKQQKDHNAMISGLNRGDEVITASGIAGVVIDIGDNFVTLEVADKVQIRVQKMAIGNVLPKGTLKSA